MCHPECRFMCDDPISRAVCQPACKPPDCTWFLDQNPDTNGICSASPPNCWIHCPQDQCETDAAPACEIKCDEFNLIAGCQIQCEALACKWLCDKPVDAVKPKCELNCEQPSAPLQSADLSTYTARPLPPTPPLPSLTQTLVYLTFVIVVSIAIVMYLFARKR